MKSINRISPSRSNRWIFSFDQHVAASGDGNGMTPEQRPTAKRTTVRVLVSSVVPVLLVKLRLASPVSARIIIVTPSTSTVVRLDIWRRRHG